PMALTKLMQWLLGGGCFIALWLALMHDLIPVELTPMGRHVTNWLPLYAGGLFGLASALTIVYRVLMFNDCPEAHSELVREIDEAKADLAKRGFKFVDPKGDKKTS
ncbi:hypothetical protein BOX15_Mlig022563g5, partial [Macrostomum lignano]